MSPAAWAGVAIGVVALIALAAFGAFLLLGGDDDAPVASTTPTAAPTAAATQEEDDGKPDTQRAAIPEGSTSVDVTAAGVDFGWLVLPNVSAYPAFDWVVDDSDAVTVQVPASWTDRDVTNNAIAGVAIPSIWAAPDLDALVTQWTGPGVMVELLTGAAVDGTAAAILADMGENVDAADACESSRSYVYDDGWYVGSADLHSDCGTAGSALLQIVAAESVDRMLTVQVQMTSTADIDAAVQIINTFQAISQQRPAPAPVAPRPPAPAPAPAPAPPIAEPVTVYDLSSGLYCRDLNDVGFSYAEAVLYWELEGYPSRMDADNNGIPCETVYPAWEVENYWGFTPDAPPAAPVDESAAVLEFAHQNMYTCGYSPALDSFVDGPFADGGYTVTLNVDVGYDIIWAQFEVFPYSWQIYGFDGVANDLLACNY